MSIQTKEMYTVICDNCGKDVGQGAEYSCWSDAEFAEEQAMEGEWIEKDNLHFCPQCYELDEETDEYVIKTLPR